MNTYVVLIRYTAQGIEALKEAPQRAENFTKYLASQGITDVTICWTFGSYDGVVTFQAPDDAIAHRAILTLAHLGNVKTETLRGYHQADFEPLLSGLV